MSRGTGAGPRGQRRDGRTTDTRRRIEETALRLFVTKGFATTSLKDIADELGITKAAVYYHFPAKADLALGVFQPFVDDVDALFDSLDGKEDLSDREVLEAYTDTLLEHRAALAAMLRDPGSVAEIDLEGASARWLHRLGGLLSTEAGTPAGRVRATVAVGGLTRAVMLPGADTPELRDAAVDAALAAAHSGPRPE